MLLLSGLLQKLLLLERVDRVVKVERHAVRHGTEFVLVIVLVVAHHPDAHSGAESCPTCRATGHVPAARVRSELVDKAAAADRKQNFGIVVVPVKYNLHSIYLLG